MKRKHCLFGFSFFLLLCIGLISPTFAQKGKNTSKETGKEKKEPKDKESTNSKAAKYSVLDQLTREEKNTMVKCPLHGSHMPLSDNYSASAGDSHQSGAYPFAYQLNYRRFCKKCTRAFTKEKKASEREAKRSASVTSLERCTVYDEILLKNGERFSMNYAKQTSKPHE